MSEAKLTSKGQITIPKDIREHLKLGQGDKVEFFVESDGVVVMWPVKSDVRKLKGIVPLPDKPVTLEEMKESIVAGSQRL